VAHRAFDLNRGVLNCGSGVGGGATLLGEPFYGGVFLGRDSAKRGEDHKTRSAPSERDSLDLLGIRATK
jgi:hypothetical protein